jgi:hypothetical protein
MNTKITYRVFLFTAMIFLYCIFIHVPVSASLFNHNNTTILQSCGDAQTSFAASYSVNKKNKERLFVMRQRLDNKRMVAAVPHQRFNLSADFFYTKIRFFTSTFYLLSLSYSHNNLRGPPSIFI